MLPGVSPFLSTRRPPARCRLRARTAASLVASLALSLLGSVAPRAAAQPQPPPRPVYRATAEDAVTADNRPRPVTHPGGVCPAERRCYVPDANPPVTEGVPVDSHTGDIYERPTASGAGAAQVLAAVDIVSTKVGSDARWFYFRIDVSGPDPETGELAASYGFELDFDDDVGGELLVLVTDPSKNLGTRFGTDGVALRWNKNDNVIGVQGLAPDDGPEGGDGYEVVAFEGGVNFLPAPRIVPDALVARVAPKGSAVELAVQRKFLDVMKLNDAGLDLSGDVNEIGLRPAAAAAPIDPSAFNLNDRFGRRQSGSPYPFLRLRPPDPGACPDSDEGLSVTEREALDSGTDQDTGIANPCYPTGGVAASDNAYYLHTTYTPEVLPSETAAEVEGPSPSEDGGTPVVLVVAAAVVASGAVLVGVRRGVRRRARQDGGPG